MNKVNVALHLFRIVYRCIVCSAAVAAAAVDYLGGWAAFCVSILIIGMLTAVIGDVASHFGCTVGLLDAVTALSFVALGTSIPGQGVHIALFILVYQISTNIVYRAFNWYIGSVCV